MTFTAKSGMTLYATVPAEHHDLIRAVVANNYVAMADCAWKNKQLREKLEDRVCKEISSECTTLNSSQPSPFKLDNNESLKRVTPGEQEAKLNRKAQLLLKCLKSTAYNHKALQRNTVKTKESVLPVIMIAASVLLHCHSQKMDLHANLISLILRRGGADKITFERLNKLNLCLSYPAALKRQSMLSENSENRVKSWCKMQEVKHTVASQAPSLDKSKLSITLVSQRTEGFEPKQEITAPDICMQEF